MGIRMKIIGVTLIATGVLVNSVSAEPAPPGGHRPSLSNDQQTLLKSGKPLNVVMDPSNGQVISVTPRSDAAVYPD
ncbi:hypothetical protein AB0C84_45325 [Actinomadura sp. NPDC048955]|uniref:hypothetical protein n=1 Tax=Actinomadura sp. NPDC048955 TaxID=3158228 RepID=UPI0033E7749C